MTSGIIALNRRRRGAVTDKEIPTLVPRELIVIDPLCKFTVIRDIMSQAKVLVAVI